MNTTITQAQRELEYRRTAHGRKPSTLRPIQDIKLKNIPPPPDKAVLLPFVDDEEIVTVTAEMVKEELNRRGIKLLNELTVNHISDKNERALLAAVIESAETWKLERLTQPGLSFVLMSRPHDSGGSRTGYGCGKTTIAKALLYSKVRTYGGYDDIPFGIIPDGVFLDAARAMSLLAETGRNLSQSFLAGKQLIVVDDIGREGVLPFVKTDSDTQSAEKQSRYYMLINYAYERDISLVLTANMRVNELKAFLGGASWSRLEEMTTGTYRWDLTGVQDYRLLHDTNR